MTRSDQELTALADKVFQPSSLEPLEQVTALAERAPIAHELATLAFKDKNKTAWRLIQNGIFELPMFKVTSGLSVDGRRRPFFRGDLVSAGIRDIVWNVEEQNVPQLTPPRPMVGEEAAIFIEEQFRTRSVQHHPMFKYLAETKMTDNQQRAAVLAYMNSVMVRIRTVHRSIMLVQLPMEFHDCIKLAVLVVDELGGGVLDKAHAQQTANDIKKWGETVDWHAPVENVEMRAMLNWNLRTVTHPDSLWAFTGIFSVEWNSYLELRAALLALRERGIGDDKMEVLVSHGEGAPYDKDKHAFTVRQELGRRIETPADCAQVYSGIAYHQGLYHTFFDGEFAKLRRSVEAAT
ncbi:MAG: iron-containing redox enzyme family protein [Deltaproteobacteria bacterium]|nr:iron-containing redox enzyme family protein [Deltaproteobacteria bacterium]